MNGKGFFMPERRPAVAGQFYPMKKDECLAELQECLADRAVPKDLPDSIAAAIVPHAGWVFSGSIAGLAFNCIKKVHDTVDVFILFGAAHSHVSNSIVYDRGLWTSPIGAVEIHEQLAEAIINKVPSAIANRREHSFEHSIEVQIPFIQYLFPKAKIVPVIVPPVLDAIETGNIIGDLIKDADIKIVCIGSTDLTHYGPRYGFNPQGSGQDGIEWAKEVNDMSFIENSIKMMEQEVLSDSLEKHNACGPGAAAATVAAAKKMGKEKGKLLVHEHSNDVMKRRFNQQSQESVGYASIIF